MDSINLRCVVCGRLKPTRERWSTFVDAMRGHTRAVCGVACLKVWAARRDEPAGAER